MTDILDGIVVSGIAAVLSVSLWFWSDESTERHIKKLCERDGFFYVADKRFECHPTAPKSP